MKKEVILVWLTLYIIHILGVQVKHIEVSRLEVKLELQLPAYTIATATQDPSCISDHDLHHSTCQCWIINPLSEAKNLMSSWTLVGLPLSHNGNSLYFSHLQWVSANNTAKPSSYCIEIANLTFVNFPSKPVKKMTKIIFLIKEREHYFCWEKSAYCLINSFVARQKLPVRA